MSSISRKVATDVGGTFTDLVVFETDKTTGRSQIFTAKTDTTPPDFEQGVLNVLAAGKVDLAQIDYFAHGTTVVIHPHNSVFVDSYRNIHIEITTQGA